MTDADVVVIGAGAAGLSLVDRLASPVAGHRSDAPTVTLVDAPRGPLRPPARTWCFWENSAAGEYDPVVAAAWDRLRVRDRGGRAIEVPLGTARYKMIRSPRFEAWVTDRLADRPEVTRLTAEVTRIEDGPDGAVVHGLRDDGSGLALRARWVFDSRPLRSPPPARTALLQHFRGWYVRCEDASFEPGTAELMDFRTPQPDRGLSFGYVLPLGTHEALVEYTEFSAVPLAEAAYERALRQYTSGVLGLRGFEVTEAEQGAIPMTDAALPRRVGASVFRIGAAGGATRPSTGYTFAAIGRQTRAVAEALHCGRVPEPPPAYPARHLAMDAVMLRALGTGRVDGAAFFTRLFAGNPPDRLLRFLDGRTGLREDFAIGLTTPVWPMLRTAVELPAMRRHRTAPHG
ncbi:lycopene cyclase family protein [Streptomyces meridianus]|uniref:Lycopene cyclase family protein n=1 Tax=Streptomyces meridianus TaxID=2938945 RepID=A0ABT0XDC7_9ACTN|nr:lycopene cyclase family protein [Streptomyces meridianus]MCM2580527.1 lycopene cyclase family protein [Streptomyces meridianus]